MASCSAGVVVPIPTRPRLSTIKVVDPVVEPIAKYGTPAVPGALMEKRPNGVELPTPILGRPPLVPIENTEDEP